LNGTKQFVTNGGLADIFFTFAKVDGDKFTAFVLEKGFAGVHTGPEETKMGLRGTSTVSLILDNASVPAENVLFEVGRGHVVAFNVLDLARIRLGAACVGFAKLALESCVKHARERVQFGRPISEFGLIKHKIAEMATRTYVAESMVYRTGGIIDSISTGIDPAAPDARLSSIARISDYAMECSINKVYCSEMIGYVADEAVQILGGYGFIEDNVVERIYRDCRVYRIFEGTNEINRIAMMRRLLGKAMKNDLPLPGLAAQIDSDSAPAEPGSSSHDNSPLAYQIQLLRRAKRVFLLAFGSAVRKYGDALGEEEEIVGWLADIVMEVYAVESGLLRALKSVQSCGEACSENKMDMAKVYINDAMGRIGGHARNILAATGTEDSLRAQLDALARLSAFIPINSAEARRRIADRVTIAQRFTC
ncbi:MAG: acyl-CoA dehydrogenase family protein, partial [Chloroflexi bacterium]|nr:acyl-CoA dehydrogenase family protein [Chloroflexota bacterium]